MNSNMHDSNDGERTTNGSTNSCTTSFLCKFLTAMVDGWRDKFIIREISSCLVGAAMPASLQHHSSSLQGQRPTLLIRPNTRLKD